ncbi:hypothetical protein SDC9_197798 [bioreactor metagenome]|uniref:Uncharacterized protein n=1 Tax=bioreactor metagenome TaxID=1076179 RepID=A0A645IH53_9ZZZZ
MMNLNNRNGAFGLYRIRDTLHARNLSIFPQPELANAKPAVGVNTRRFHNNHTTAALCKLAVMLHAPVVNVAIQRIRAEYDHRRNDHTVFKRFIVDFD